MNRRTCPGCGGRSYSSYSGTDWDCPYCGRYLGHVPNELSNSIEAYQEKEMDLELVWNILYSDGMREEYDSILI